MDLSVITSDIKLLILSVFFSIGILFDFVGLCVRQGGTSNSLGTSWFVTIFFILLFVSVIVGYTTRSLLEKYRLAAVAFLTLALSFVVGNLSGLVYSRGAGAALQSTGNFFLAFAIVPLILMIGSEPNSLVNQLTIGTPANVQMPNIRPPQFKFGNRNNSNANSNENIEIGGPKFGQQGPPGNFYSPTAQQAQPQSPYTTGGPTTSMPAPSGSQPAGGVLLRATALYPYTANAEDPNEISFSKGDVLEVLDNKGKWWQARRTSRDGSTVTGIVPSNYLQPI
ncbi:hypothetical protein BJ742DRAFT_241161 [Cladochytrium replicatum]|nr:hypothetical protein BJ742DRAFT_241161 [Cladochytrium replicatum]